MNTSLASNKQTIGIISPTGRGGNSFVKYYNELSKKYNIVFIGGGGNYTDKQSLNEKIESDNAASNRTRLPISNEMTFYQNVTEAYKNGIRNFIDTRRMGDGERRKIDINSLLEIHQKSNKNGYINYLDIGPRFNAKKEDMKHLFDNQDILSKKFLYHHTDKIDHIFMKEFEKSIQYKDIKKNNPNVILIDYASLGSVGTASAQANFATSGNLMRKVSGDDIINEPNLTYFDRDGKIVDNKSNKIAHILGESKNTNNQSKKYLIRTLDPKSLKVLLEQNKINYNIKPDNLIKHIEEKPEYPYIEINVNSGEKTINFAKSFDTKGEDYFSVDMLKYLCEKACNNQRLNKRLNESKSL